MKNSSNQIKKSWSNQDRAYLLFWGKSRIFTLAKDEQCLKLKAAWTKWVSGRQLVDGSPVQPQKLRQNQHSASPKQRQHKILTVLPQGAVKGKSAKWCETPGSKSIGKKSVIGQFSCVCCLCFCGVFPLGLVAFFYYFLAAYSLNGGFAGSWWDTRRTAAGQA